jgi:hypothetical protein
VSLAASPTEVRAIITGSQLKLFEHLVSLLVIDASTGAPIPLSYGPATTRSAAADGTLSLVTLPVGAVTLPASVRVHLMVDAWSVATATLTP